jgi:hypothetical protein
MGLSHVTTVRQGGDNSLVVYVETDSFKPDQQVEVSVYLTQGDAYAAFNEKKRIPFPDPSNVKQPTVLHVELPRTELDPGQPLTIVTRVAEVWPTVLQPDPGTLAEYQGVIAQYQGVTGEDVGQELKAVWTSEYPSGKALGG